MPADVATVRISKRVRVHQRVEATLIRLCLAPAADDC
jgi:hypothetical protein